MREQFLAIAAVLVVLTALAGTLPMRSTQSMEPADESLAAATNTTLVAALRHSR
jgi:hypothetical protein